MQPFHPFHHRDGILPPPSSSPPTLWMRSLKEEINDFVKSSKVRQDVLSISILAPETTFDDYIKGLGRHGPATPSVDSKSLPMKLKLDPERLGRKVEEYTRNFTENGEVKDLEAMRAILASVLPDLEITVPTPVSSVAAFFDFTKPLDEAHIRNITTQAQRDLS